MSDVVIVECCGQPYDVVGIFFDQPFSFNISTRKVKRCFELSEITLNLKTTTLIVSQLNNTFSVMLVLKLVVLVRC